MSILEHEVRRCKVTAKFISRSKLHKKLIHSVTVVMIAVFALLAHLR